jgi:hypothetical protein
VTVFGRIPTRILVIFIIITLNKIFEYVEITTISRYRGSIRIPRRFGGFVQVLQTVQVTELGRQETRIYLKLIILTLNKIFEYVEITTPSRPRGSTRFPRRFDFFV